MGRSSSRSRSRSPSRRTDRRRCSRSPKSRRRDRSGSWDRRRSSSRGRSNLKRRQSGSPTRHHTKQRSRRRNRSDSDSHDRNCCSTSQHSRTVHEKRERRSDVDQSLLRRHDGRPSEANYGLRKCENERSSRGRRSPVQWGKKEAKIENENEESIVKAKPNYEITGALAADTNTYKGVVIKYTEPHEARKPKIRWSLYPFKGEAALPVYHIHRQSAYLFGRDRHIADIPIDHPSCSKQHAVFQFRAMPVETDDGRDLYRVKPYLIDLGSANGTYLNDERLEPQRYYELFEKDVFRFGYSTREYVLLNEKSADDDIKEEDDSGDSVVIKQEIEEE